ncbi:MAG: hypothetical protein CVU64_15935 [Deltaproteobacteria bacterium HGW-Deltaproteobacteria-21]|nr:MAG: hypothetical protein CVU64_15935 [Deltaproteobacteria bacterium HGW-Deltaproteobacteria-21]
MAFAYLGTLVLVTLIVFAVLAGFTPTFFIQGTGPTLLRQIVLGGAVGFYAISSLLIFRMYTHETESFFKRYSLGLLLTAIGLFGVFFLRTVGGPISWLGRVAQYTGGVYFLLAVVSAYRSTRARGVPLGAFLSEFFRNPQELYRTLVQTVSDAIVILDQRGRVLLWNPAAEKIFGYPEKEAVGSSLFDLILTGRSASYLERCLLQSETVRQIEIEAKTRTGRILPIEVSVSGSAGVTTAIIRDITGRKQAEDELRASEQKYRTLFDSIDEGFCIIEVLFDENEKPLDYRFLEINPSFERQTGINNAVGRRMREIASQHEERWFEIYGRIALTGDPVRFENPAKQLGRFYEVYAFRVGEAAERKVAILFNDISERKRTEEAIRERERDLERAQAVAHLGSWRSDLVNGMVIWSEEAYRIFGVDPKTFTPSIEAVRRIIHPESRALHARLIEDALSGKIVEPFESRIIRPSGEERVVLTSGIDVEYDASGKPIFLFGTILDITDRKKVEAALRESEKRYRALNAELELRVQKRTAELERKNRELQEFAFVASHDLSEPLRKIQTFGSLLQTKSAALLGDEEKDYVARMTAAAGRMRELLDALLRYSRLDSRGQEFIPTRLDSVVKDAVGDLEIAIRNAGARLEIGPLPMVNGAPNQLRQLFQNLIANAVKYRRSESKPFIKISGEVKNGEGRLFVEDNGIGFDEKYLEKIFQPFQRLHGVNEYSGTGVGLAICKKVVERHGGTITAKSTPGKGSTFIVTLPVNRGEQCICNQTESRSS